MYKYELVICRSREDDSYIAELPELAGCMADDEAMAEALKNANTMIGEWRETAKQIGRTILEPKGRLACA